MPAVSTAASREVASSRSTRRAAKYSHFGRSDQGGRPDARSRLCREVAQLQTPARSHRSVWYAWVAWCAEHGHATLPADPAAIAAYLAHGLTGTGQQEIEQTREGARERPRGVPWPSDWRMIRLRLNAPTWISIRLRIFFR